MAKLKEYHDHLKVRGFNVHDILPAEKHESRSIVLDPYEIQAAQQYLEAAQTGHTPIFNNALRDAANETTVAAIRKLRGHQVGEMTTPRENEFESGFDIVLRERESSMSPADHKESDRIRDLILSCGETDDVFDVYCRDNFEAFARKVVDDSLTFDSACFEIVLDRENRPKYWKAVDAATVYRCTPTTARGTYGRDDAAYMQYLQGMGWVYWPADEFCMGIRNPTADIRNKGYGQPEIYTVQAQLSALMMNLAYNVNFHKNGGPRGVFMVKGEMEEEQLRIFKRQILYGMQGYKNAFRMPIVNPIGPDADIKWIPFVGLTPNDMQHAEWQNFLIRVVCSVYAVDPSEIGHYFHQEGGEKASMFETSPEAKLKSGRDRGLRPLLRSFQGWMNKYIVWRINPRFQLQFLGLDTISEQERIELDLKRQQCGMTVAEWRAERNLPKLKSADQSGAEDLPLNPTFMQAFQIIMNQKAQAQQAALPPDQGGQPGAVPGQDAGAQPGQDQQGGVNVVEGQQPAAEEAAAPAGGAQPEVAPGQPQEEQPQGNAEVPGEPSQGQPVAGAQPTGANKYDWTVPEPEKKPEPEAQKSWTVEV